MNRKYLLILSLFIFNILFAEAYSQQSEFIPLSKQQLAEFMPSESRVVVNLSGAWQQSTDEIEWSKVYLPNSELLNKKVSFRRTLKISRNLVDGLTWHLYFLGLLDQVEVYFNEQFVGRYFGGMTPFKVRIPRRMIAGETNTIKLVVSPLEHSFAQVTRQNLNAKRVYTGLIRELLLIGTPSIWVSDFSFRTAFNKNMTVCKTKVSVNISTSELEDKLLSSSLEDTLANEDGNSAKVRVELNLIDKSTGEILLSPGSKVINVESQRTVGVDFSFTVKNPKLWSVNNPELYYLQAKITKGGVIIDEFRDIVGFRSITTRIVKSIPKVYLNNKPLEIKGISYIEDIFNGRQSLTAKQMEYDIKLIKTLGANAIRFKYSAPHPYFAHLCDKNGILMMIELPLYDVPESIINIDGIRVRMKNQAKRIIPAFDKHPSLLAWGVMDGAQEGEIRTQEFSNSIVGTFRSLSDKLLYKIVCFGADTINSEGYDLIGIRDNRKTMNFKRIKDEISRLKSFVPSTPVFVSYGTAIQPNNHNGYSDHLSLEYQAYFIRNNFVVVRERQCAGSIIDSYNDYILNSPALITNNDNQYLNTTGMVDGKRNQRLSYTTLQTFFNNEKEPLLNAGSYKEKTPISFIILGIGLGVVMIFLINRFRRFREYLFRSIRRPYNFYADIRDQRIMSSFQTILLGIVISLTYGIFITSILYFYRTNELSQYCLMILIPSAGIREVLFRAIWMPEVLMIAITIFSLLLAMIFSLLLKLFAFFFGARIYFSDTITITIWSGVPFLFFLPVAIVLIRALVLSPGLIWLVMIFAILITIWVLFRFFKATRVVFDKPPLQIYLTGAIVFIFVIGLPLAIFQYKYSIFEYAQYFIDVMLKT